jgi:hypothetical protein
LKNTVFHLWSYGILKGALLKVTWKEMYLHNSLDNSLASRCKHSHICFALFKNNSRWFSLIYYTDLSEVDVNTFLGPFLDVIRSEDTTGPITGVALTSVNKFLSYGLIGKSLRINSHSLSDLNMVYMLQCTISFKTIKLIFYFI